MIMVCPSCGALNRIPEDRSHTEALCGQCKGRLHTQIPAELTDSSFATFIKKSSLPVVVDFWASWCSPCKMMAPIFEKTASESPALLFAKVNTEQAPQISAEMGIQSIPTLILFHQGQEVQRSAGAMMERNLKQWLFQGLKELS